MMSVFPLCALFGHFMCVFLVQARFLMPRRACLYVRMWFPETGPRYVVTVSAPNQRLTALLGDRHAAE